MGCYPSSALERPPSRSSSRLAHVRTNEKALYLDDDRQLHRVSSRVSHRTTGGSGERLHVVRTAPALGSVDVFRTRTISRGSSRSHPDPLYRSPPPAKRDDLPSIRPFGHNPALRQEKQRRIERRPGRTALQQSHMSHSPIDLRRRKV